MKKLNKLFAILVAMAMVLSLTAISAFAAVTDEQINAVKGVKTFADAAFVKEFDVANGVTVPDASFTFTFAVDDASTATGAPAAQTLTFDSQDTVTNNKVIKGVSFADMFALGTAPATPDGKLYLANAGVYIFNVTETGALATDNKTGDEDQTVNKVVKTEGDYTTTEILKNSEAQYKVRIYVINDDDAEGGLALQAITVELIKDDDGNAPAAGTSGKTSPKPTKDETGKITDSDFKFTNNYTKEKKNNNTNFPGGPENDDGILNVRKKVTGALGAKDQQFPFEMTLTLPENYEYTVDETSGKYVIPAKIAGKTPVETVNFEFTATNKTATATFTLADNQTLKFAELPFGATYTVTEDLDKTTGEGDAATYDVAAHEKYTPSAETVTAINSETGEDMPVTVSGGVKGEGIVVNTANTIIKDTHDKNVVNVTNDRPEETPEGILISNLPYIALALVAIGGLVAYVVVRRRNADEA